MDPQAGAVLPGMVMRDHRRNGKAEVRPESNYMRQRVLEKMWLLESVLVGVVLV
jgi:hypothetical protein